MAIRKQHRVSITRRDFLTATAAAVCPSVVVASDSSHFRDIPSSGERIPALGMGTWITFDVRDQRARETRLAVLREFFNRGGRLVDSSPMYGRSPDVVGYCLERLDNDSDLFSASKVWVNGADKGVYQVERSAERWGLPRFDLVQVHNMVDWRSHLPVLKAMQAEGNLRYVGITTSHGRRHSALADALRREQFDFVQFTYNIADRQAEQRLLPLAQDRGTAVIINRPFRTGALFSRVRGKSLPGWAAEINCDNWAQVFLKFVIAHPAVTVAIPATSQARHMRENMGALTGQLPDESLRRRMAADFERI
ncbi:MAG: aldo/keto reductase [Pseudomonadota bacterium]